MWYWVDSLENGEGVYSCNFEGNKRSLLYSLLGSVLKQAQSWVLLGSQSTSRYLKLYAHESNWGGTHLTV